MTDPTSRLCGCGCGTALTHRQAKYASRACTQRVFWADPELQERRRAAMRKAKGKERLRHWWHESHLSSVWGTLTAKTAIGMLDAADQAYLQVVLSRTMAQMYQRGYRVGWQAMERRARAGKVAA